MLKSRSQFWLVPISCAVFISGLIASRRAIELRPYRDWQAKFLFSLLQPDSFGCTFKQRGPDQSEFEFVRRVYRSHQSAYEEFKIGSEGDRMLLIQPLKGASRAFIVAAEGHLIEKPFQSGFTSMFSPFDAWEIGTSGGDPIWTFLTNAQLLHMPKGMYRLTWEQFCDLPARRLADDQGLIKYELYLKIPARAQPVISLRLDPNAGNQLTRATAGFPGELPVVVNNVVSGLKTSDGRSVPQETSLSDANQETRIRIENPTFGPIASECFDVNRFKSR